MTDKAKAAKVVVFGATGRTGVAVLDEALARGLEVTAFVRSPAKLEGKAAQAHVVQGDVTDPAAVERAVRGQDAVLIALGHTKGSPPDLMTVAARHIVAAMNAASVRRVVGLSGVALRVPGDPPPGLLQKVMLGSFNLMVGSLVEDGTRFGSTIMESGLDWTLVRPMRLVDGPKRGGVKAAPHLPLGMGSQITRADLAQFMVDQVGTAEYVGKAPMVTL